MRNVSTCLCLLLSGLLTTASFAQPMVQTRNKGRLISYNSVGIQAGIMNYFGDLNPLSQYVTTDLSATRPGLGITLNHRFNSRFTGRIGFLWGRLTGDDSKAADPMDERHRFRYVRNQHFRNDIFELSAVFEFDLLPTLLRNRYSYNANRIPYSPYLLLGISGFYHNPKAKTPTTWTGPEGAGEYVALHPLRTEGQGLTRGSNGSSYESHYSRFQIAIPMGVGARFKIAPRTQLAFEVIFRYTLTDYIDDVGANYANPSDLPGGANGLAAAMADRTLEPISAFTGDPRLLPNEVLGDGRVISDGLGQFTNGYGRDGDKRGEGNEDLFVFTGFHLTYIFGRGDEVICAESRRRRR